MIGMSPARERAERWPHVIVLDPFTAGLALARAMSRAGARVSMLIDPSDAWTRHARGVEAIVAPFGDGSGWLELLERMLGTDETVVLPATDRSCELLLDHGERLPDTVLGFERSGAGHRALMDKQRADAIARRAGVAVPWTAAIGAPEDLERAFAQAPWPCVVKPVFSHQWRERYGQERVFVADGPAQAARLLERPLADSVGMLLCQYIPGGDEDVEEAILVRLADGSYPVRFGCRKLRQNPPGFGATSVGEASPLPETTRLAERVLEEAGFVGVAGVETKRHAQTGERWFLEVNVRIPGQWGLGDACGVDATRRLVMALARRPLGEQPPLRAGVRFVVPDADAPVVRAALAAAPLRRRPAVAWRMARAYRGARNFGLLDARDPGPGVAFLAVLARRRLAALGRRLGARRSSQRSSPPR
jgi:predicted ATP-grasp superfamily ATP-dependent carboligase